MTTYYEVWDETTANMLGVFETEQEAKDYIEEVRPYGRYGPDGHKLVIGVVEE